MLVIDYVGDTLLEYEIVCGLMSCIRQSGSQPYSPLPSPALASISSATI
jgi:hypothetical protein